MILFFFFSGDYKECTCSWHLYPKLMARISKHTLLKHIMARISGEDIAVIQNLLNRVMHAMDDGDGPAFAACFTADGTCDILLNGAHKSGTAELADLGVFLHAKFPTCRHWEGNVCVVGTVTGAANKSYWKALEGGDVVSTGIHEDQLVLQNGEWLIQARTIRHTWTKTGGHIA